MNNQCIIYCRVSTKEQYEEGTSLAFQEQKCREYAMCHNHTLAEVFLEKGESAKTKDRPELQRMLNYCRNHRTVVSTILIYKIDRLSRNTDDYSTIRLYLKRYNITIVSITEEFEDTPLGKFMENLMANLAQFDNDIRTERTINGMKQAVFEGRYVWKAPIGYENCTVEGKATIRPSLDGKLITRAFELIATNTFSPKHVQQILGMVSSRSQFYRTLHNPIYAGIIEKFGTRMPGKFLPLVSMEIFEKVQHNLSRKKVQFRFYKITHPDFPLKRFITDRSGSKLTGYWSTGKGGRYAYYRFSDCKIYYPKAKIETLFISFVIKHFGEEKAQEWLAADIDKKIEIQDEYFPDGLMLVGDSFIEKTNYL